tara:strand:+ start:1153 stop:1608 length:456 start_codon:yes stop_codon:yes gene_type:complete
MPCESEWIAVSETTGEILKALNAASLEIGPVNKSGKAAQQMGGYAFRTIDDVVNACSGPMNRNGLVLIPAMTETKSEPWNDKWRKEYARYRFRIMHVSGEFIETEIVAQALDNGDKGLGKTFSYALKELLCRMFLIPTGDDTESTNYGENR